MTQFWLVVGKLALRAAMWCLKNPDKVDLGITDLHKLLDVLHKQRVVGTTGK